MKAKLLVSTIAVYPNGDEGVRELRVDVQMPKELAADDKHQYLDDFENGVFEFIERALINGGYSVTRR
jgi:hypothetical protein